MIRSLIRYLRGYVKIRVEGYSPERFLNLCCFHHIFIWGLTPAGNAYEMYMSLSGFRKIRPFTRKTHTRAVILFIWDIHFEGNQRWPDETLTEFLDSQGVAPFMLKSRISCADIVKEIRREYNDIVWVSASIDGSRLKVQIKENEDTFREDTDDGSGEEHPTDLIAETDGVITQIVTRSGVPQVHAGDTVKAGDLLVSGRIEVLDDSGEVVGYQYQRSDADVFADTQIEYADSIPLTWQDKIYDGKKRYRWYVRFFDWTISAGTVSNSFEHSETASKERQIKIGENFYLPVSFGFERVKSYGFQEKKYTKEEIQQKLTLNFRRFCNELEEKGIQIRENSVKIHIGADSAGASGSVYLNQRITKEADTEILTIERKEQDESVGTDD